MSAATVASAVVIATAVPDTVLCGPDVVTAVICQRFQWGPVVGLSPPSVQIGATVSRAALRNSQGAEVRLTWGPGIRRTRYFHRVEHRFHRVENSQR